MCRYNKIVMRRGWGRLWRYEPSRGWNTETIGSISPQRLPFVFAALRSHFFRDFIPFFLYPISQLFWYYPTSINLSHSVSSFTVSPQQPSMKLDPVLTMPDEQAQKSTALHLCNCGSKKNFEICCGVTDGLKNASEKDCSPTIC